MIITTKQKNSSEAIKFLIFGESGAGKTYLASTLKEKTLIISAESGLLSLKDFEIDAWDITRNEKGEIIPKEKRFLELKKVYKWLISEKRDYKNVYLDSLTEMAECLVEFLKAKYPEKKDALLFWGEYATEMRNLIKDFRDLDQYNVVFTCLDKRESEEEGGGVKIRPQLSGQIARLINQYFDQVFYLFIDKEDKRKLLTKTTSQITAKDRSGKLDKIEEPNLEKIIQKIKG